MIYEFQASQDLHGWEKPWAPGSLFNQWDEEWVLGSYNTTTGEPIVSNNQIRTKNAIKVDDDKTYYIKLDTTYVMRVMEYDENDSYTGFDSNLSWNREYTPSAGTHFIRFYIGNNYGTTYNHDIAINYPATETAYTPYANVCMPEGFNIWDPTAGEFVQVYAGYVNSNTRELYLRPVYQEYAGEELVGPWMSSWDPYEEDTTPTEGAFVIDFGGELTSFEITPFMLQTLLDSLGIRQHFTDGAGLLNSLMDQAQGRVRSEEELLHLSRPLKVIAIGDQLPAGLKIRPISKDVLPGLPGKFIR